MTEQATPAPATAAVPAAASPRTLAPDWLVLRLTALAALLTVAHGWVIAHLGSVWPVAFADVFALGAVLTPMLQKKQQVVIRHALQDLLNAALQTKVLLPASIAFVVIGSFISSVTVLAAGTPNIGEVKLTPETSKHTRTGNLKEGTDDKRFVVFTNPFGRSFALSATQYQRYSFDVYPWLPMRIRVPYDLRLSPSLLVRLSSDDEFLQGASTIQLFDGERQVASTQTKKGIGAAMFGPRRRIPEAFENSWLRQLRMRNVPTDAQPRLIDGWFSAEMVALKQPIEVGEIVVARLKNDNGLTVGETEFVVTSEAVQDVLIGKK